MKGDPVARIALIALLLCSAAAAQKKDPPTLRSILLEQFKSTHTDKDWFVSVNVATAGMTPE